MVFDVGGVMAIKRRTVLVAVNCAGMISLVSIYH
jgi:hypothetical protein